VDDTAMVMIALAGGVGNRGSGVGARRGVVSAGERAKRWLLAMQNSDGGWGAFDRDNDAEFLCRVPFADHNAMIDPSTPDLAGRALEALASWSEIPLAPGEGGRRPGESAKKSRRASDARDDPAIHRAIEFLRRTQERDGC